MELITVASFSKPEDAHLLRIRLEAGGVPAYLQNENLVQIDWLYSNAVGGVRVQIDEQDVEKAREILTEEPLGDFPIGFPVCPVCASSETEPISDEWKCLACGHVWSELPSP